MAFSQAVSGLNAAATNLDVIGNNIANSATYGFEIRHGLFCRYVCRFESGTGGKSCRYALRTLPMARPPTRWILQS